MDNQNNKNLDSLVEACNKYDIRLTTEMKDQFIKYYDHLIEINEHMNLTAITQWDDVVLKHFIDSISLLGYLNSKDNSGDEISKLFQSKINNKKEIKVLDLGTGAGFPGIPLKIVCPELNLTLADSLNKRVNFLKEIITLLDLTKTEAIHGRAEELSRKKEMREKYDLVVSRAVANASTLCEYCLPFVKPGGYFVSYKTESVDEEEAKAKNAIKILGGTTEKIYHFNLYNSDMARSFLIIKKINNTPKSYPRKAGQPSKDPIQ
ncbi:MAG: 16S rRNA (guanine(527)-N(7))-methyltransferase RsmG [Lachnospiraceae bacterium]|nr:16S rRNA (guanine(527)-N(7))-methyltransferase RsmG [Lachnospiraceae bacterium]